MTNSYKMKIRQNYYHFWENNIYMTDFIKDHELTLFLCNPFDGETENCNLHSDHITFYILSKFNCVFI